MNDAVGSEDCSVPGGPARFRRMADPWPVIGQTTIKFQEKNGSMSGDVVTIVILFVFVQTVRSDYINRGISAECLEEIADIDARLPVCLYLGRAQFSRSPLAM